MSISSNGLENFLNHFGEMEKSRASIELETIMFDDPRPPADEWCLLDNSDLQTAVR